MSNIIVSQNFVEISDGCFFDKNKIKLITQRKTASRTFKNLVDIAKSENKYFKLAQPKGRDNVYVLSDEGCLYLVSTDYDTLIQRCLASGLKMVKVSSDAFVPLSYIKAIYDLTNNTLQYYLANTKLPKAILQFVSHGEERKTVLILKNDEIIYLSKSSKEILETV